MNTLKQVEAKNVRWDEPDVVAGPPTKDPQDATLPPPSQLQLLLTVAARSLTVICSGRLASVHDKLCG